MVRKYPFADITLVVALFLNLISLLILNSNKLLVGIIGAVVLGIAIVVVLYFPVRLHSILNLFNTNVVFVLLFYLYSELYSIETKWIIPSIAACLLAMICLIFMRSYGELTKGRLVTFLIFILVLAVALGLFVSVAEPAGSLMVSGFGAIERFFKAIGNAIERFFNWLVSLLPDATYDGNIQTTGPAVKIELPEEAGESSSPSLAATIIAVIVVLAGLISLVRTLIRKGIAKKANTDKLIIVKRKKRKLSVALESLFKKLVHSIRMMIFMMGKSNLSKYYRMVYSRRFTPAAKKIWETPREFLGRIMGKDRDESFINSVEKELYS